MSLDKMNIQQFVGRLIRDPELRETPKGKAVLTFTLAFNTKRTVDAEGNHINFMSVEVWEKDAVFWGDKLRKGMQILVRGELYQSRWSDSSGEKRSVWRLSADKICLIDLRRRLAEAA